MWGGVKVRKQYGDHFRSWSATKGLDELRKALYREPRPWYLAFGLHQRQHLLQDHHCARIMSWCATTVQLRPTAEAKQEAYKLSQETFGLLVHSHKVGPETLYAYMRLCAVGRDMTSAYNWHRYWLDAKRDDPVSRGAGLLRQYAWLLRIALESPSDEAVEDMAAAVLEGYNARCCTAAVDEATGERVLAHFQPSTPQEEAALQSFFCGFKAVELRLARVSGGGAGTTVENSPVGEESPQAFAASLPVTAAAADQWARTGWPTRSHSHNFPHLEGGVAAPQVTPARPCLRDSLLSQPLITKLEEAAFTQHDVAAVIAILKWYQASVSMERDHDDSGARRAHQRALDGEPLDIWRQFADPTAIRLRAGVVAAGGLTSELYHYIVAALAPTQPTAALRTLSRMAAADLRVLDVTRAVALVAAQGSFDDQRRLFKDQLAEIRARQKLDEDYDISKQVEVWWKYQYADIFHHMNGMGRQAFYEFLMEGLPEGPHAVQQLLLAVGDAGPTATADDPVLLDEDLRRAAVRHFRGRLGPASVDAALDIITRHMPKLDVALVGALPHFADYALSETDDIATDTATLTEKLRPYDTIYLLDTSFVETGEAFLNLGRRGRSCELDTHDSLVLVPFVTLAQLGESVENAHHFVTFDSALAEAVSGEPLLASQRLRALFALTQQRPTVGSVGGNRDVKAVGKSRVAARVLHFTECLLAHALPRELVEGGASGAEANEGGGVQLQPATSDDDHLLLVMGLVRSLAKPGARVVLCSDDPGIARRLRADASGMGAATSAVGDSLARLLGAPIDVLTTEAPGAVNVDSGVLNDNPQLEFDAADFTPKLELSRALREGTMASRTLAAAATEKKEDDVDAFTGSPWLSMLDDGSAGVAEAAASSAPMSSVSAESPVPNPTIATSAIRNASDSESDVSIAATTPASPPTAAHEDLMDIYESPHDVVPVGEKMRAADDLGSVFAQFDILTPEEAEQQSLDREARRSRLQHSEGGGVTGGKRRRSSLEREMLRNRGASYKERRRIANTLSNMSGGRVPFNLRYKVVEANVNDPRNAALRQRYEEGMRKKRDYYRRYSGER